MEVLIHSSIDSVRVEGFAAVSLSLSPFHYFANRVELTPFQVCHEPIARVDSSTCFPVAGRSSNLIGVPLVGMNAMRILSDCSKRLMRPSSGAVGNESGPYLFSASSVAACDGSR